MVVVVESRQRTDRERERERGVPSPETHQRQLILATVAGWTAAEGRRGRKGVRGR